MTSAAIKVIPFEASHLLAMKPKDVFGGDPGLYDRVLAAPKSHATAMRTISAGDKPIAVVAMTNHWNGVAETWSVTTDDVANHAFTFLRVLKDLIATVASGMQLHRVHMTVREDFDAGKRLAVFLGFKEEGLLEQFGPDKADYRMFVRLIQ